MALQIQINGEPRDLAAPVALSDLLADLPDLPENFAIALNAAFVPRSAYPNTNLADGDEVELLVPMQGG